MDRLHPPNNQHATDGSAPGSNIDPLDSNFQWLGGRRYFAHAPYLLPYDDGEFTRLDFEHYLVRQTFKTNVLAPIGQPHRILDVGIGTGRWALETAAQFPSAAIVGMDLTRPPTIERIAQDLRGSGWGQALAFAQGQPTNFNFVAGNVLSRLPFPDGAFDYVHMRFLSAAIPLASWRQVMFELARVTRRGGWIEVVDTSWTPLQSGPATEQLFYWARIAGMIHEINLELATWIGSLFLDSGLGNVTAPRLQLPMGRATGRIGSMVAANAMAVAEAIQPWVIGYNIASTEEFASALTLARSEVTEGTACAYPIFVAYGQRL
jgi:ubiquinone/menaquinone biosynthesis C-methylase UbiE